MTIPKWFRRKGKLIGSWFLHVEDDGDEGEFMFGQVMDRGPGGTLLVRFADGFNGEFDEYYSLIKMAEKGYQFYDTYDEMAAVMEEAQEDIDSRREEEAKELRKKGEPEDLFR